MKTVEEIIKGKEVIVKRMSTENMNSYQFALLMGMINAMNWAAGLPAGLATATAVDPTIPVDDDVTEAEMYKQIVRLQESFRSLKHE